MNEKRIYDRAFLRRLRCGVEPAFGSAPRRTSGAEEIVRLKSELEAMRLARVEDHMTCARLREERDNAVRKWTVVCEAVGDLRKVDRATADWLEAYCRAADEVAP